MERNDGAVLPVLRRVIFSTSFFPPLEFHLCISRLEQMAVGIATEEKRGCDVYVEKNE
jgi:hypothetical protein